ncbi:MAG: 2-C-methyl-D-erythritol 4-phosphate cytidylyltransferase [Alistipes sp.]|nr:2-C-methyl-D-erythritol 4-phosphate cytidylyltransferase [Alistipes sp.]
MERVGVIIVAGGAGTRCGGAVPKQFALLGGMPVLARTIGCFAKAFPGAPIVVVLPAAHIDFWHNLCARFDVAPHSVVEGGSERFFSVRCGLAALPADIGFIAVQDGVRPLGSPKMIRRIAATAAEHGAAVPVVEPADSYRELTGDASHAVDRRCLRIVQTPQIFRADLLREAYRADFRPQFTDDASVVELAGHAVRLCEGERHNLKITAPEDFAIAEALLAAREENAYVQLPEE